jgi:uncharacterized protein (TIGR00375 family)
MIFADLHIHSRFSRATSKDIDIENLEKWAKVKGIDLLGTGDFSHPEWLKELKENLQEKNGILYSKSGFKFMLSGEISLVFTKGRGRRVHLVLLVPSFEIADKINSYLDTKGRRDYDGRPIFNISCEEFVFEMKKISDKIEIIPAHIWTPWFGVLGSKSGFDSLKEAFGAQYDKIHAIETGISSTPEMNLRLKELHEKTIVSFSDLHSFWPWRMGREMTIFSSANSYEEIIDEIRKNKIIGTVEVNPAYGMYHYDGHRNCNFSCSPEETKKLKGICSVCNSPLTIGVDYRVQELADAKEIPKGKIVYEILPLHEIIALVLNSSMESKKVWEEYTKLISAFNTEMNILLNVSLDELKKATSEKIAKMILKNREGKIKVKPGYDGVYGKAILEEDKQVKLF